jgi:GMP synthase-like glutamine amidotransferase
MTHVLILGLYNKDKYNKRLVANLDYYKIKYTIVPYYHFHTIDFSKYTHIILTGSDFYVYKGDIVLSKEQVEIVVKSGKPVLAECYGFQLLAYHTSGVDSVGGFVRKRYGHMFLKSPILRKEARYFMNHWNYVKYLSNDWDFISKKTIIDKDGSMITFILDGIMKDYPVLGIQYHPEFSEETYDFIYEWIIRSKSS